MGILSLSLGEQGSGRERRIEKEGEKGKERERGEKENQGELKKGSHRRRYVRERGRDGERVYRNIQSTDVPESKQASKSEKIGL